MPAYVRAILIREFVESRTFLLNKKNPSPLLETGLTHRHLFYFHRLSFNPRIFHFSLLASYIQACAGLKLYHKFVIVYRYFLNHFSYQLFVIFTDSVSLVIKEILHLPDAHF